MTNLSELHLNARRTRRNVMKMGVILASSAVAGVNATHAATPTVSTAACAYAVRCNCFLKGTKI